MKAQELFRAGHLAQAIGALSAEVRDNPGDTRRRTFLFELLCFAGESARADKQLEVLRLRDLLWTPAAVRTTPSFKGAELGEVLLQVLFPFSWQHSDDAVRLGQATVWEQHEGYDDPIPFGQKMWLVDDEEVPFLDLRALDFSPTGAEGQ